MNSNIFNKNKLLPTFSDNIIYCALPVKEHFKAVDHLYKSMNILETVVELVDNGAYDALVCSEKLKESWYEINCCRIYTEKDVNFEELLQPALGYVSDAKSMIDSLVHWNLGLTKYGRLSILSALNLASKLIRYTLEELELASNAGIRDNRCVVCNRIYLIGDKFCSQCGNKI